MERIVFESFRASLRSGARSREQPILASFYVAWRTQVRLSFHPVAGTRLSLGRPQGAERAFLAKRAVPCDGEDDDSSSGPHLQGLRGPRVGRQKAATTGRQLRDRLTSGLKLRNSFPGARSLLFSGDTSLKDDLGLHSRTHVQFSGARMISSQLVSYLGVSRPSRDELFNLGAIATLKAGLFPTSCGVRLFTL